MGLKGPKGFQIVPNWSQKLGGAFGTAGKPYLDQLARQRGAGGAQALNLGAKLVPKGPLDEAKGWNLAETWRRGRF